MSQRGPTIHQLTLATCEGCEHLSMLGEQKLSGIGTGYSTEWHPYCSGDFDATKGHRLLKQLREEFEIQRTFHVCSIVTPDWCPYLQTEKR
jgi:hypothetical protein